MAAYLIRSDDEDESNCAVVEAKTPQEALDRWDGLMKETWGEDAPLALSCELLGDYLVLGEE